MAQLEIACFHVSSALIAQEAGADRIELCRDKSEDGLTPDSHDVELLAQSLSIPMNVMIRPRGGDFNYSNEEYDQMKESILAFKQFPINGFVFGILDNHLQIDIPRNKELVNLAAPFPCTLHKAFDQTLNMEQALQDSIHCGFKTILTSAQARNVVKGLPGLTQLVSWAKNKILIMPGGGLRSENCKTVKDETKAIYFHSSAITDGGEIADGNEIKKLKVALL